MNELIKYVVAGLVNTATGYGVFWVLLRWVGYSPELANTIGYIVALCVAFLLNRFFVFKGATVSVATVVRFFVAFASAFLLNQVVLFVLFRILSVRPEIAQIFSMSAYTAGFYLLNKYCVFNTSQKKDLIACSTNSSCDL
jgi:putative flippase GtrA